MLCVLHGKTQKPRNPTDTENEIDVDSFEKSKNPADRKIILCVLHVETQKSSRQKNNIMCTSWRNPKTQKSNRH